MSLEFEIEVILNSCSLYENEVKKRQLYVLWIVGVFWKCVLIFLEISIVHSNFGEINK